MAPSSLSSAVPSGVQTPEVSEPETLDTLEVLEPHFIGHVVEHLSSHNVEPMNGHHGLADKHKAHSNWSKRLHHHRSLSDSSADRAHHHHRPRTDSLDSKSTVAMSVKEDPHESESHDPHVTFSDEHPSCQHGSPEKHKDHKRSPEKHPHHPHHPHPHHPHHHHHFFEINRHRTDSMSSKSTISSLQRQITVKAMAVIRNGDVGGYGKIIVFTLNILFGLVASQVAAAFMPKDWQVIWHEAVRLPTTLCLAFIMVNVGYEFVLDKSKIKSYGVDFLVALTAAGLPWLLIAAWFIWVLPDPLPWRQGLLASCFGAPTSAGILFCMLEAANLKETWLFKKARVLAIFDDLDTILLLVPLKALLMGVQWELFMVLGVVVALLIVAYTCLHRFLLPASHSWMMLYAFLVTLTTEVIYQLSKNVIDEMDTVHLEVLLPAFTVGAIIRPPDMANLELQCTEAKDNKAAAAAAAALAKLKKQKDVSEKWQDRVSAVFMVLVGLSMPALFGDAHSSGHRRLGSETEAEGMSISLLIAHVAAVSLLMVVGKMFLLFCYCKEANLRTRLAISLGMCPRGEVGAGVIVISLGLGVGGDAAAIAIICLALNITMSGLYILAVKKLVTEPLPGVPGGRQLIQRRTSHLHIGECECSTDCFDHPAYVSV